MEYWILIGLLILTGWGAIAYQRKRVIPARKVIKDINKLISLIETDADVSEMRDVALNCYLYLEAVIKQETETAETLDDFQALDEYCATRDLIKSKFNIVSSSELVEIGKGRGGAP